MQCGGGTRSSWLCAVLVTFVILTVPSTSLRVPLLRRKKTEATTIVTSYLTAASRNDTISDYQVHSSPRLTTKYHDNVSHGGSAGVKLQERGEVMLLGEIMVGTPPTKHLVDFDTGSSVMWLFGEESETTLRVLHEFGTGGSNDGDGDAGYYDGEVEDAYGGNDDKFSHTFYRKSASRSYKPRYDEGGVSILNMEVGYEDGDMFNGEFAGETLQIGNLRLENAALGITTEIVSCGTGITGYDGIFGLGIDSKSNNPGITPPFIEMVEGNLLGEKKLFSLYLSADGHYYGEILFGEVNKQFFSDPLNYTPRLRHLEKEGQQTEHWAVPLDRVTFGEYKYYRPSAVLIDSGSGGIIVPRNILKSIVKHINRQGSSGLLKEGGMYYYEFDDCDKVVRTLPDLTFVIHGEAYTLRATEYFMTSIGVGDDCSFCVLLLQTRGTAYWVFGEPFLKAYYTVFDYGNDQIGFAPAKHDTEKKGGK